jgi:hypothetical protein
MEIEEERHVENFIKRGVTVDMIKQIDIDNSGEVDKAEFLCYMLVMLNTSYIAININTRRNAHHRYAVTIQCLLPLTFYCICATMRTVAMQYPLL